MAERVKSEPNPNAEPCKAKLLKFRLRTWQINADYLDKNPHWIGKRVAKSGAAWGEEEPPVDDIVQKRKKGTESSDVEKPKKRKKAVKGGAKGKELKARVEAMDVEGLFDDDDE